MKRFHLLALAAGLFLCSAAKMYAQEITIVFAANNNTKEVTVSLPHIFWGDWSDGNGELDLIIQYLYDLPFGGFCDVASAPVASGNPAVSAGIEDLGAGTYVTVSQAFEGTAIVTGVYHKYTDSGQLDTEVLNYSLTISIKIVRIKFEANGQEKTVEVKMPHTFTCTSDQDGELDLIIQYLYELPYGGYCDENETPVASGDPAVSAGKDAGNNHYITISPSFEGTATVTGVYWAYEDLSAESFTYSLTIAVKSDDPEPEPTAIEDVLVDNVQGTKFYRDGQFLIERNGKLYNAQGAQVK